jgi:hypothetical protein
MICSFLTALVCVVSCCGSAQPANDANFNNWSNAWYNEFVFLPGGSRIVAKRMSATNETFRLAIRYIAESRSGHTPPQLPEGLTQSDISNAEYKVSIWPMVIPPRIINFYGKVVDENGQPVAAATAHFEWDGTATNKNALDFSDVPKISSDVTTDNEGLFSLTGKFGTQLDISVGKLGYYSSRTNRSAEYFKYSQPNLEDFLGVDEVFKPNSNSPVLYFLRKQGIGADSLVTSQYGMRNGLWASVPKDGTPVKVDLLHRKVADGPLTIMQMKPEFPSHGGIFESLSPSDRAKLLSATNWSLTMEIGDGGFIEENDEFAFNPPESGYQPVVKYDFQKGQTNWTLFFQKDYYIKFGSPALYGQLHLETWADRSSVILIYVINPDGSRNLEPKIGSLPSSSH